jgi:hypothetical protein
MNNTCNFLRCNYQVHVDFLITLYFGKNEVLNFQNKFNDLVSLSVFLK